ncbi:MAG: NAD(P)-binding domain-containing protein [Prevotella sp.]|jgi:pyrroline-5-carboxylate reductase|uniref:Pyrroline-5-carboxylate reductase n=1 Tax=Segatella cerevisiae TaxID=2053716 RepID=A0ABT1BYX1_9BACT|nr:pyrroline-5-carboxylate reductase dimerization domain-containing protein [Segatella cerevisiae]MCH3995137.1 NAD(P)-binding domain-containing protein [Prevotella sp.]MCI1247183.1 NAD(P)-binding domain-containing protein [Prevotella sp.]MCO6026277.1 NAD(P)-binding domain-containing protein [Segatella cerevisiae]
MKISVIGAGAMGGAFAEGLLKSQLFKSEDITVADPTPAKLEHYAKEGASITTENMIAAKADIVSVVVKPGIVESILKEIKDSLDYGHQMLIIIAAGISSGQINSWLDKKGTLPPYFMVIPNIAIAEKASMTFIVPQGASDEQTKTITSLFDELGGSMITKENLLAAGTTLASCGIAYALRYIRASAEGGVELGFKASDATRIVAQTVEGAVKLLQAKNGHPEALIDQVTTPGGVTIQGLNEMEHAGFTSAVIRGLKAGI